MISVKKRVVSGVFALAIMASSMGAAGGTAIDNSLINVSVSASADTIKSTGAVTVANTSFISTNIKGKISWGRVSNADGYFIKYRVSDGGRWGAWREVGKTTQTSYYYKNLPVDGCSKNMMQIAVQPAKVVVQNKRQTFVYADINSAPKINICPVYNAGSMSNRRFGTCGAALASVLKSEKYIPVSVSDTLSEMYKWGYKLNVANNKWNKATNGKNELSGCKITQLRDYVNKKANGKIKATVNTFSKYSNQQIKNAIDTKVSTNHRVIVGYRSSSSVKAEQRYMVICASDSNNYIIYNPINGRFTRYTKDDIVSKINRASSEFKGMLTLN